MEVIYFTSKNLVRKTEKVIDFQEYKRKKEEMERVQEDECWAEYPVVSEEKIERPASQGILRKIGDCLDAVASLALAISAVTAVLLLI